MSDVAIKIENLKKQYRLGVIGGTTLNAELQSWWARKRGKEDPNVKLGEEYNGTNPSFWALNGIDLEVKKGEALGIIGSNGAGKSTLLKILSRVTAPTEGDIWINGRISSMLEVGTGFHGELTGRENIYMNGAILGMSKREVDAKMEDIIDFSECRQFIDTPVKRYSSGMYVKLAFAVAANLDSEILVMDEVLAVGDMKFQKKCLGKMGDVAENEGKTVLYVSHNMATIRNLCTRCIVMNKGKVIYDGKTEGAIQVYLQNSAKDLHVKYNVKSVKRPNDVLGKKCRMEYIELLYRDVARYKASDKMYIKIIWRAYENIESVKIGFSLHYIDSTNIGFAESVQSFSLNKGEKSETTLEFDLHNLAEGIYFVCVQIFSLDIANGVHGMDQIDNLYFEVVDDDRAKAVWQRQYWGNIRFDELAIVEDRIINENLIL